LVGVNGKLTISTSQLLVKWMRWVWP
jgi:hypothetical protein